MARQLGPLFIRGTIDNLTFYKMGDEYFVRKKSRLPGKKVKTHPHFYLTRINYGLFSIASKIGSRVYRMFPREERVHDMYKKFTGEAMKLLKQGLQETEVEQLLIKRFVEKAIEPKREVVKVATTVDKKEIHQPVHRTVRFLKQLVHERSQAHLTTERIKRRATQYQDYFYYQPSIRINIFNADMRQSHPFPPPHEACVVAEVERT